MYIKKSDIFQTNLFSFTTEKLLEYISPEGLERALLIANLQDILMALEDSNIESICDILIKSVFLREPDLIQRFVDNVFNCCKYREFYVDQYVILFYALYQTIQNATKIQNSINLGFQTRENIDMSIFTFSYLAQNEKICKLYVNKQLFCFSNKKENVTSHRKSLILSENQNQNGNKNDLNEDKSQIISVINMNQEKSKVKEKINENENENESIEEKNKENEGDENEIFFNNFIMKSDSILNFFRDRIFTINQSVAIQPWRLFCISKLMRIFNNDAYYKYIDDFFKSLPTIEIDQMNVFAFFAPIIKSRSPLLYEMLYNEMKNKKLYSRLPFSFNEFCFYFEEMDRNEWKDHEKIIENCGFYEGTPLYAIRHDDIEFFKKRMKMDESLNESEIDLQIKSNEEIFTDFNMRVKDNIFFRYPQLKNSCTLLQLAAYYGSEKCFEFLLENGADPKLEDLIGLNVMHYAVIGGSNVIIFKLQKLGFSFDIGSISLVVESYRFPLFQWILSTMKVDFEESFLQTGTIIHRAASSNNILALLFISSKGANINVYDTLHLTPLFYAAANRSIDAINLLFAHKNIIWDLADKFQDTPLHGATKTSDCDTFAAILNHENTNLNVKDFKQKTALMYAIADGKYEIVQMVLSKYGDVVDYDNIDNTGQGLGFVAPFSGFLNTFILCCNCQKIDLNKPRNDGNYIIHIIVSSNKIDFVRIFMEQERVDPNVKLPDGSTALHIAAQKGFTEIVQLLIDNKKTDVNIRDGYGITPLHLAIKYINTDVVKILVNCDRVDRDLAVVFLYIFRGLFIMVFFNFFSYLLPIDFAKLLGLQDIVEIFLKKNSADSLSL